MSFVEGSAFPDQPFRSDKGDKGKFWEIFKKTWFHSDQWLHLLVISMSWFLGALVKFSEGPFVNSVFTARPKVTVKENHHACWHFH